MIPRLGINIDHVATLRQARGEDYPSIVVAATNVLKNGADQITIHLREDRRHIQDTDVEAVRLVTRRYGKPLNLEMATSDEIVDVAIAIAPDWVCLVPEKREEKTTEGGLDLTQKEAVEKIQLVCHKLKKEVEGIKISLFVEANEHNMNVASELGVDAVEIHTGDYAKAHLNGEDFEKYLSDFQKVKAIAESLKLGYHAGHGLTDESVLPLLQSEIFEEYNIGHWVVCQAVFDGIGQVVSNLKECFRNS